MGTAEGAEAWLHFRPSHPLSRHLCDVQGPHNHTWPRYSTRAKEIWHRVKLHVTYPGGMVSNPSCDRRSSWKSINKKVNEQHKQGIYTTWKLRDHHRRGELTSFWPPMASVAGTVSQFSLSLWLQIVNQPPGDDPTPMTLSAGLNRLSFFFKKGRILEVGKGIWEELGGMSGGEYN